MRYFIICLTTLLIGCSPPVGSEGGACYGNGTCDEGLLCLSDLCVTPGPASLVTEEDAGVLVEDSGVSVQDGGVDAGSNQTDGGNPPEQDSGVEDSGSPEDAGVDAGYSVEDAGADSGYSEDAGYDAGYDAGPELPAIVWTLSTTTVSLGECVEFQAAFELNGAPYSLEQQTDILVYSQGIYAKVDDDNSCTSNLDIQTITAEIGSVSFSFWLRGVESDGADSLRVVVEGFEPPVPLNVTVVP